MVLGWEEVEELGKLIDADRLKERIFVESIRRPLTYESVTDIIEEAPSVSDKYGEGYVEGYIEGSRSKT